MCEGHCGAREGHYESGVLGQRDRPALHLI
jgi:hypothetical protein